MSNSYKAKDALTHTSRLYFITETFTIYIFLVIINNVREKYSIH